MIIFDEYIARFAQLAFSFVKREQDVFKFTRVISDNMKRSYEELRLEQLHKLSSIIDYAYLNNAFYRDRFRAVGFEPGDIKDFSDIHKLPKLCRTDVRDYGREIVCDNLAPENVISFLTGGTTGIPITFYRDRHCHAFRRGIDFALASYYGWRRGQWQGWIWGAPHDLQQVIGWKGRFRQHYIDRKYFLDVNRISNESYQRFIDETDRYRPSYISAYPSLAYDLAERIEAGDVTGAKVPVISVTAEPLYEYQRKKIEQYLADVVYQRYGSREFGTAAYECPHRNGQHIFVESVYIESVPVDLGNVNTGEILVTDLLNKAMPLVRYQVGDFGVIDDSPCSCGLATPRITELHGREADIIWRPDGTGISGTEVHTLAESACIMNKLQIVQDKIDQIVIHVEGSRQECESGLNVLITTLKHEIGDDISYSVKEVDKIELAPSGKYRYVVSNIKRPKN